MMKLSLKLKPGVEKGTTRISIQEELGTGDEATYKDIPMDSLTAGYKKINYCISNKPIPYDEVHQHARINLKYAIGQDVPVAIGDVITCFYEEINMVLGTGSVVVTDIDIKTEYKTTIPEALVTNNITLVKIPNGKEYTDRWIDLIICAIDEAVNNNRFECTVNINRPADLTPVNHMHLCQYVEDKFIEKKFTCEAVRVGSELITISTLWGMQYINRNNFY